MADWVLGADNGVGCIRAGDLLVRHSERSTGLALFFCRCFLQRGVVDCGECFSLGMEWGLSAVYGKRRVGGVVW